MKNVFKAHQKAIAIKTLRMPDEIVNVMGYPNKCEAVSFLKKIGYLDKKGKRVK